MSLTSARAGEEEALSGAPFSFFSPRVLLATSAPVKRPRLSTKVIGQPDHLPFLISPRGHLHPPAPAGYKLGKQPARDIRIDFAAQSAERSYKSVSTSRTKGVA